MNDEWVPVTAETFYRQRARLAKLPKVAAVHLPFSLQEVLLQMKTEGMMAQAIKRRAHNTEEGQ